MADDKKNIPEAAPPTETPSPEPVLTDAEAVMLEHEGQAVRHDESLFLLPRRSR